jgi:hypothetical protein
VKYPSILDVDSLQLVCTAFISKETLICDILIVKERILLIHGQVRKRKVSLVE